MVTAEQFEPHRPRLFSIAYRMLGSAMEAEDMVQETYLRYHSVNVEQLENPSAFLNTVITRLCMDHLKSARVKREKYIGPWLPEPVITTNNIMFNPAQHTELEDTISLAFLVLLESLTPLERAVFLLRAVFDYTYDEIADITGQSLDACRQSYSRAKRHIQQHQQRFTPSPEEHTRILTSFMQAVTAGDVAGLTALLAEDVQHWSDGGGKTKAATRVVVGADKVSKLLSGVTRHAPPTYRVEVKEVNGQPALVVYLTDDTPFGVVSVDIAGGKIQTVHFITNPDKLKALESTNID